MSPISAVLNDQAVSVESSQAPLRGLWKPTHLNRLHYGSGSVREHLLSCLPNDKSRAFIITGSSLADKTGLVKQVEQLLGSKHAGTFSKIKQHAPVKELDEAAELVLKEDVDTVISIGGGSPIDSAKVISNRVHEKNGDWLFHITIPTTLSAAECTMMAGYTNESGLKTGVSNPQLVPHVVIYDSSFLLDTPPWLLLSTAIRAMDHAVEQMYHPTSTEMPSRQLCLSAVSDLFVYLPKYKRNPKDEQTITRLQLASFASLGYMGLNVKGGLGLSHALGYALGSPYGIPHGITSCLTLGHVVKLKAKTSPDAAAQLARLTPYVGLTRSGDDEKDAVAIGDAILQLVEALDLKTTLTEKGVGKDQIGTIVKNATGQESGQLFDSVKQVVESLY